MKGVLESRNRPQSTASFQSFKAKTDTDGNIVGYSAMEAVYNAFSIIMEFLNRFEVSSRSIMHIALPMLYKAMRQHNSVANGGEV